MSEKLSMFMLTKEQADKAFAINTRQPEQAIRVGQGISDILTPHRKPAKPIKRKPLNYSVNL